MPQLQIAYSHNTNRVNNAWWDAKLQTIGEWHVHFHADYVPSTVWVASDINDVMSKITIEMNEWKNMIDARSTNNLKPKK